MIPERRNDIGNKILVSVISALVTVIMGITWLTATGAANKAQATEVCVTRVEGALDGLKSTSLEVRDSLAQLIRVQNGMAESIAKIAARVEVNTDRLKIMEELHPRK